MGDSAIEWTDKSWNPVTGCSKVSPGCAHCYAEGVAERFWATQCSPVVGDDGRLRPRRFTDVQCYENRLDQPLHWKKPSRIFVNSMSDLFHEDVPDRFIDQVFAVMALAPQHTFQVLTKRAQRMLDYLTPGRRQVDVMNAAISIDPAKAHALDTWPLPLPNVWLGVSVENQHFADERIPLLLQTPAAVRFISAEPLLGPIELVPWVRTDIPSGPLSGLEFCPRCASGPRQQDDNIECPDCGYQWAGPRLLDIAPGQQTRTKLDWVIVGGESGPKARPFEPVWARSIVRQCKAAGVAPFVKQLGSHVITRNDDGWEGDTPKSWPMDTAYDEDLSGYRDGYQGAPVRVRLVSKKGGDPAEWPECLRVREFPR